MRKFSFMFAVLAVATLASAVPSHAGLVRYSAKQSYHGAKKAAHYSAKAGKKALKIAF